MAVRWLALTGWMIVILFNSSVPGAPLPTSGLASMLISKAGHVVEYALLGWLGWRALVDARGGVGAGPGVGAVALLLGGALFAGLDELRQLFVPGRGSSFLDVVLDLAALTSAVVWLRCAASQESPDPGEQPAGEDRQKEVHR